MVMREMLALIVTAWLNGHLIGVVGLGTYPANSKCDDRGEAVVEMLYKQQPPRRKGQRIQFRYRCVETPVLRV